MQNIIRYDRAIATHPVFLLRVVVVVVDDDVGATVFKKPKAPSFQIGSG